MYYPQPLGLSPRAALKLSGTLLALILPTARAADATWTGTADSFWSTTANWSTSAIPGAGDIATFNNSGNGNTIISLGSISLSGLTFDTSAAAAYTLGTGADTITFANGTTTAINLTGSVAANETINANLALGTAIASTTTFRNNGTGLLTLGGTIAGGTGGTAAAKTLIIAGSGDTTITGVIDNGGATSLALAKADTGTLTLSGANTFTGGLTLSGGTTVATGNAGALGAGALTLSGGSLKLTNASGANLNFGNATTIGATTTITSDVTSSGAGNTYTLGTLTLGGQLDVLAGANVSSGTAGVTFGATTLSATVQNTIFNVGSSANLTLGALSGNYNLWKQGAGTLTLAADSSTGRTGGIFYLDSGTLVQANASALGSVTANTKVVLNGGTWDIANDTSTSGYAVILNGNSVILSDKATAASSGITHTLGTLTSTGANTLTIGKGGNVGSGTATVAFGAATINADTTFSVDSGAALTLTGTLANGGYTPTFTGAGDSTVTGAISGGGGLSKSGNGTLTLSSANTYTGATAISGGTVVMGNATALGAASTAVLDMSGNGTLNTNGFSVSLLRLTGASGTKIQNTGATNAVLTVTPVANSTSAFAGSIQNGGAGTQGLTVNGNGALTLSGNNTYTGATTLTAGQLNLNSATALGGSTLTLTTGILDNTAGAAVTLANNNNVTLNGNFSFGGSDDLSFGSGTLTTTASRTVTLMGAEGSKLKFGTWNNNFATSTTTVKAMPGSNSELDIGTFISTSTATAATILGNGNIAITGGIQPGAAGGSIVYGGSGTLTLSGTSTYTGTTTLNGGSFVLDASGSAASLNSGNAMNLAGGSFVFKGDNSGTGQTLGNIGVNADGASTIKVVAGTSGTTLALGSVSTTANNGLLNINLDSTAGAAAITTSTGVTNSLLGSRGAVTVTTGGTTEFATKSGSNIVQYTGQTAFANTGASGTVNYKLSGSDTLAATESMNSLKIETTGAGQSLDLNGNSLTLTSGGLLFTGADAYEIKDAATGGSLKSATATNSDLIIHNFGTGGLTISSVIANGSGTSVVSLDGTGTTTLSGVNTYTGATLVGGGATLAIGANSGLGAVGTGATLTLNNGTLRATDTFALDNAGANSRAIRLGAGGGTFDVTGSNTLTVSGAIGNVSNSNSAGSLTKTGAGTLLLTGNNGYSGGFTNVQNGALQIGGASGAIASGNVVVLGSADTNTSGKLILGDASNVKTVTVAGLTTQGAGAANAVVGGNAANSTLTYTGTVAVPTTFNGKLGGAGANENNLALNITAGQLTLGGDNTYAGGTTLAGGVLNINSNTALGTGAFNITGSTVIDNTGASAVTLSAGNNVTLGNNVAFGGSNDLSFGTGTLTTSAARTIALNGDSTLAFGGLVNGVASGGLLTLTVNGTSGSSLDLGGYDMQSVAGGSAITNVLQGSGNINITGAITNGSQAGGNANALNYKGTGVLTLSGANTYTGLTTVTSGILKFGAGGSIAGGLFNSGGVVDIAGQTVSISSLSASSSTSARMTSSVAGGVLNATVATTGGSNGNTFDGTMSVNLTMAAGTAASTFSSFNNTGNLTLTNNSTNLFTLGTVGSAGTGYVTNNGNVTFNANDTGGFTVASNLPIFNPAGAITNAGTGSGTTTFQNVAIGPRVTSISNTNNSPLTISSKSLYVNSAGLAVNQTGTGLLSLTSATTLYGTGNLTLTNGSTTGGNLTMASTAGFTGNLTLKSNASSGTPGVITVSGAVNNNGAVINSGTGTAATTISGVIGQSVTGVEQNSATSALVLSGVNTYTGATRVTAGTLFLGSTGSLASASYSVANGGTFDVSSKSSYSLASVATTIGVGSTTAGFFNGPTGTLTLGNSLTLDFSTASIADGQTYNLFDFGGKSGNFSSVNLSGSIVGSLLLTATDTWTGLAGGYNFTFDQSTGNLLVVTAVPEPSVFAALAGALALSVATVRRRRSNQS